MKYTGLKNNYIDVEGSFGGNQEWLKEEGRPWKGRAISGYGCGLIGASDLLLHVLGRDIISQGAVEKRSENKNHYPEMKRPGFRYKLFCYLTKIVFCKFRSRCSSEI